MLVIIRFILKTDNQKKNLKLKILKILVLFLYMAHLCGKLFCSVWLYLVHITVHWRYFETLQAQVLKILVNKSVDLQIPNWSYHSGLPLFWSVYCEHLRNSIEKRRRTNLENWFQFFQIRKSFIGTNWNDVPPKFWQNHDAAHTTAVAAR